MKTCLLLVLLTFAGFSSSDAGDFANLSFLEGCWKGQIDASLVYENWGNNDGNMMLGMSKTISNGNVQAFEFLALAEKEGKIHYVPYVNGINTISFPLTESTAASAHFDNAAHDFPKSIQYTRYGSTLHIALSGDGEKVEYDLQSVPCVVPEPE